MDDDATRRAGETTADAVARLQPWFHNLHLPDGTQTAPEHFLGDYPAYKWGELRTELPADLSGWSVLDVGCNAGFHSFELARRGASVRAIDSNPRYLAQARWAATEYGLDTHIRFEQQNVYSLLHDQREYDLVLFMGVLYHLRYPLLGLDCVARRARGLLALQTLSVPGESAPVEEDDLDFTQRDVLHQRGWPSLAFIEHHFAGDPTTWWIPNHPAIDALLRSAGLRVLARPGWELYVCTRDSATGAAAADYDTLRSLSTRE